MLYTIFRIYKYTLIHGNIINCNDNFNNEQTHFFIKISLTLYFRKGDVCWVWEMSWRQRQTVILTHCSSSPIAALLSHLGLGCSTGGNKGLKPSVFSWVSLQHPFSNWLESSGHLVILLSYVHLLLLFFRLFMLVHLLIDGSVKGQYITLI